MRRAFIALAAMAVAAPVVAQPATISLDTYAEKPLVDRTTQSKDVRLRTEENQRMTVPVTLSGTGPWQFIVDTGANRTSISSNLAASLGLTMGGMTAIHTVTGIRTVQTATVPDLQLSDNNIHSLRAPLLDAANMGADGMLGVDSLQSQQVVFDFTKNTMSIVPAYRKEFSRDDGAIVIYGRLLNGRLIVTHADADGTDITVVLDTGSEVCVGNAAMHRWMQAHGQLRQAGNVELQSVTGEKLLGQYTFVKELKIGGVDLHNLAVVFADAHTFQDLGLDKLPALLLGMNAMRAFKKVSIDFAHQKFKVIIPEHGSLEPMLVAER
jgi:predicted aspartyl protease